MEREVYLDNCATTRATPAVVEAMARALVEDFGNPSSLHRKGLAAERFLSTARETLMAALGASAGEIIFTSGGTEANNLAIRGVAAARSGRHLVTTALEHPSVLNAVLVLEKQGFEVTRLAPDRQGLVTAHQVEAALRPDTFLVSVMHVNNEVGSVQPVAEIAACLADRKRIVFHVDAVQSFTKLPLDLDRVPIDLLSLSAHKIHGPKGVGLLYARRGVGIEPLLAGGRQERGLRPGTENVPGIAGFEAAVRAVGAGQVHAAAMATLRHLLCRLVVDQVPGAALNGPDPGDPGAAPHIANFSVAGIPSEMLVHHLEDRGFYVSTGSACSSRHPEPSHVLAAMGLPPERISSAIRVSLSRFNTEAEITSFALALADISRELGRLFQR